MKKLLMAAATLCALAIPSKAAVVELGGVDWNTDTAIILNLVPTVPEGNQVQNLPCIICGATQPQQPTGFGYNLFGNQGNQTTANYFSTATVPGGGGSGLAQDQLGTGYSLLPGSPLLTYLLGNVSFDIGIDVNDTGVAQTLESFWFLNLTTHTVLAVYSPEPGGTLLTNINNGTGFPDWTLTGLTLAGINPDDQIIFFARMSGINDGPDSFFLMNPNQISEVPLPGAAWLFLSALGGMGGLNWLRKRKVKPVMQMQAA